MSVQRGHQDARFLKLSHDRKVSPRGIPQASRNRWIPTVPNSFGLPAGDSCPGKTEFCTSCYAERSENSAGVAEFVKHNLTLLRRAGTSTRMAVLLGEMVGRYWQEAERLHLNPADRMFRIHWDGDFWSLDYAAAWRATIVTFPEIQFWAYTRSFVQPVDVVPVLAGVPNLALYLSADGENIEAAREQVARHPGVLLALCGVDYATTRKMAPERRPIICPENAGRMELMSNGRGACVECRLCPDGRRDVMFSTSHREDATIVPVTLRASARPSGGVPVLRQAVPGERACKLPGCGQVIERTGKRGRPADYCCTPHRWAASRERAKVPA